MGYLEDYNKLLVDAKGIKYFCTERINKYGLTTPNHGACKGCPYRYRGSSQQLMCCIFSDLPYSWK